jgi:hypothetical protein
MEKGGMRRSTSARAGLSCVLYAALAAGCWGGTDTEGGEPSAEQIAQAVRDGCAPASFAGKIARAGTDAVDLLMVVDNSGSMRAELASVARELPELALALTSGDLDGDGAPDILPVQSLRVGVVTSNLGAAFIERVVPACEVPGDNGRLVRSPSGQLYFEYHAGDSVSAFDELAATLKELGAHGNGCGIEQPFEASLAALTGDAPHGRGRGPDNGDFLRDDSVLGVLLMTDEDDCSALPPQQLFDPDGDTENFNMVCALQADEPGVLVPVETFVARLRALRADFPSRLVFGAFAGVPTGTTLSPEQILELPAMQIVPGDSPAQPLPRAACESEHAAASPARRVTRAVSAFGAQGIVQSICDEDLAQRMQRTVMQLAKSFEPLPACADNGS